MASGDYSVGAIIIDSEGISRGLGDVISSIEEMILGSVLTFFSGLEKSYVYSPSNVSSACAKGRSYSAELSRKRLSTTA